VSEGQEALVGFINRFQLGGLKPVADLKAVLGDAEKAGGSAGNERFYEEGVKCADGVSEESWTSGAKLKGAFAAVATCLWQAAKSAFRAGTTAALRAALLGAIEAFSRTLRQGYSPPLGTSRIWRGPQPPRRLTRSHGSGIKRRRV
jgi:hypothetical protein